MNKTTTRRTARLTTKKTETTMPYIAIKVEHVAATTMVIPCTARRDMEITGANGAKVLISKGEKFYLYRSASLGENMFYLVRVIMGTPCCTCMAMKPCKHEIAIGKRIEVAEEEQTVEVEELVPVVIMEATVTPSRPHLGYASNLAQIQQARNERRAQERRENAPLNGNRPFSMMR